MKANLTSFANIINLIDESSKSLETKNVCYYRPLYRNYDDQNEFYGKPGTSRSLCTFENGEDSNKSCFFQLC